MSNNNDTSLYFIGIIIAIFFILLAIFNRGWQSVIFFILGLSLIFIILVNYFIKVKTPLIIIFQVVTILLLLGGGAYIIYDNIIDATITVIGVSLILSFFYVILKLPAIEHFQKIRSIKGAIAYLIISIIFIMIGVYLSVKYSIIYFSTVFFGFSLFFISLGILIEKRKLLLNLIGELIFSPVFLIISLATDNMFLKISCISVAVLWFLIVVYKAYRFYKS
jgi:hypothetical protein